MGLFAYRLAGAAMLDGSTYEGIEDDRHVTWQAAVTVLAASLCAGAAAASNLGRRPGAWLLLSGAALVLWVSWAFLMYMIGSRILPEPRTRTNFGELLRTTGFAAAPGLITILGVLPGLTQISYIIASVWMFAAMIVAIEHALDYDHIGRALAVCAVAALLCFATAAGLALLLERVVS